MTPTPCTQCGGSGGRATARSANGRELERHERSGTPCDRCGGSGEEPTREPPRCGRCKGEGILAGTRRSDGSIDQCPNCRGSGLAFGHPTKPKKETR